MSVEKLAEKFYNLFLGYTEAYGTYIVNSEYSLKKKGRGITKREPITQELWLKHLNGTFNSGIGIIPIDEEGLCRWGCMDIDHYENFDIVTLAKNLHQAGLPLVLCRSKSGGAHIFLFTKEGIPALLMQTKLRELSAALGYAGCEVFPKQVARTSSGDVGNWLNMPYFNYEETVRYGIDGEGNILTAEQFLNYAMSKQCTKAQVEALKYEHTKDITFDDLFKEGPPCHEAMYKRGVKETVDSRNSSLYSICQQFKRQLPEQWEDLIIKFNDAHCLPPLDLAEVKVIINSAKKDGFYKCNDTCCSQHCDKELCMRRPFGIGENNLVMPRFTGIQKTGGNRDCLWYLTLDTNETIELTTEELMSPHKVRCRLAEALTTPIVLPEIKATKWRTMLAEIMDKACEIIEDVTTSDDIFYEHLENFCLNKRRGKELHDVLRGKPYTDSSGTWFRLSDFQAYLEDVHYIKLSYQQISAKLREKENKRYGEYKRAKKITCNGARTSVNLWCVPVFDERTCANELPEELKESSPFDVEVRHE